MFIEILVEMEKNVDVPLEINMIRRLEASLNIYKRGECSAD